MRTLSNKNKQIHQSSFAQPFLWYDRQTESGNLQAQAALRSREKRTAQKQQFRAADAGSLQQI